MTKNRPYRKEQIASLIRNALAQFFAQGRIWGLEHIMLSVTKVTMSADLKIANCYLIPSQSMIELNPADLIVMVTKYTSLIRQQLRPILKLKYLPELRFFYDDAFDNALTVEAIYLNHLKS